MDYFRCSFRLALLRRVKNRGSLVFIAIALALTVVMILAPTGNKTAAVQVGLVLPEEGAALEALLLERSSELVRFIPTDEETLDKKVLSGQWDCGLVAREDFPEKLEELDFSRMFTVKISEGSAVYPLVQETVAACVMELTSPDIARAYLEKKGIDGESLQQSAQRVDVILCTPEGEEMDALDLTSSTARKVLKGLVGLFSLIWGLYLAADLGSWLESDNAQKLRAVRSVTQLLLPELTAALLPLICWGCAVTAWLGGWWGMAAFAALLSVVFCLGLVLPRFKLLWQSVMGLLPFVAVGSLLLEPILVDVGSLFPAAAPWLGWLPVTLYCRAGAGSIMCLLFLLLEAIALAALGLLADLKKNP